MSISVDYSKFQQPNSAVSKAKGCKDSISIVYNKNGNRISFSKNVSQTLKLDDVVQFSLGDDSIMVSKSLPNNDKKYPLKTQTDRKISYAKFLVEEIIEKYGLDYSGRTSISFSDIQYIDICNEKVAIIKIIEHAEETEENAI